MRNLRVFALVMVVFQVGGCCLPSPWVDQRFESDISTFHILPKRTPELEAYFVGHSFVNVHVFSTNPNERQSAPPFYVSISLREGDGLNSSFALHSVAVVVDHEPVHDVRVLDGTMRREHRRPMEMPAVFIRSDPQSDRPSLAVTSPFNLVFDETDSVSVIIDIEVTNSRGTSRGTVKYEFEPKESSGFFECLEV